MTVTRPRIFDALLFTGCGLGTIEVSGSAGSPPNAAVRAREDGRQLESRSDERSLIAFAFLAADNPELSADVEGTLTGTSVAVTLPAGSVVTALVPALTFTGVRVVPDDRTAKDFTHPVSYTVTAEDRSSTTYEVTVTVKAPLCQPSASGCTTDVYDRAVAFAASHPKHSASTS